MPATINGPETFTSVYNFYNVIIKAHAFIVTQELLRFHRHKHCRMIIEGF